MTFLHHASVYLQAPASATHVVTTGGVFEKFVGYTSGGIGTGGITADFLNSRIVMTQTGKYLVYFQMTLGGPSKAAVQAKVYWNVTPIDYIASQETMKPAGELVTMPGMGILDAHLPDKDLELWLTSDSDSDSLTVTRAQLTAFFLSTTQT